MKQTLCKAALPEERAQGVIMLCVLWHAIRCKIRILRDMDGVRGNYLPIICMWMFYVSVTRHVLLFRDPCEGALIQVVFDVIYCRLEFRQKTFKKFDSILLYLLHLLFIIVVLQSMRSSPGIHRYLIQIRGKIAGYRVDT